MEDKDPFSYILKTMDEYLPYDTKSQGISSNCIERSLLKYSSFSTKHLILDKITSDLSPICLIIIIKSEVWTITHCLGLGHETMVCAVCFSIFLSDQHNAFQNSSKQTDNIVLFLLRLCHKILIYWFFLTEAKHDFGGYQEQQAIPLCPIFN